MSYPSTTLAAGSQIICLEGTGPTTILSTTATIAPGQECLALFTAKHQVVINDANQLPGMPVTITWTYTCAGASISFPETLFGQAPGVSQQPDLIQIARLSKFAWALIPDPTTNAAISVSLTTDAASQVVVLAAQLNIIVQ